MTTFFQSLIANIGILMVIGLITAVLIWLAAIVIFVIIELSKYPALVVCLVVFFLIALVMTLFGVHPPAPYGGR